jgi:hypothetical protein
MYNKMSAYGDIIRGLNQARLAGTAYPVVSNLIQVAQRHAEVRFPMYVSIELQLTN